MLIPFNIENAKLVLDKKSGKVVTGLGTPVEIIEIDSNEEEEFPVIGFMTGDLENDYWTAEGKYFEDRDSNLDLFIIIDDPE